MTQSMPDDFDWITARAACSASQIFHKLRSQVQGDVEKRNSIRSENEKSRYMFYFSANGGNFSVYVDGMQLEEQEISVEFRRSPKGIDVYAPSDNKLLFQGEVTLSSDGECRIRVGQTECNLWQFRKLTLEDVFFTKVAKWRP